MKYTYMEYTETGSISFYLDPLFISKDGQKGLRFYYIRTV